VVPLQKVEDEQQAKAYEVELGSALITYDFVLVADEAVAELRREKAEEAMASLPGKFKFVDNLPIPDVD
jgi:hypothetical protein